MSQLRHSCATTSSPVWAPPLIFFSLSSGLRWLNCGLAGLWGNSWGAGCVRRESLGLLSSSRSFNRGLFLFPFCYYSINYEPIFYVVAIPLPVMYSFRSYISRSSAVRYLYSLRLSSHLISSISLHFRFVTSSRKWLRQVLPLLTPPPVTPPSLTSPARGPYSTFDTLRLGRSAQTIVARLIRLWDSRNIHKNGEFMGITILLLDEQVLIVWNLFFRNLKYC